MLAMQPAGDKAMRSTCRFAGCLVGFSLVELMVVLAVATILLGTGVPLARNVVQSHRLTVAVNDFFASINLTRAEAIRRGIRIDMVPVDGTDDWAGGWIIFVDEDNNQRPGPGEERIFVHDAVAKDVSVKANLTDSSTPYLAYNAVGRTRSNASAQSPQFGSFTFTLDKHARKIKINFLGRARVCNPELEPQTC
jgi:type IV fimbrial biogenesis protein FimT